MNETPHRKTGAVDAGVFVAALLLLFVSIAKSWTLLAVLSGVVLVGVMMTNAARRQMEEGDRHPRGERPWRRDAE